MRAMFSADRARIAVRPGLLLRDRTFAPMRRKIKDNALSLTFLVLFLLPGRSGPGGDAATTTTSSLSTAGRRSPVSTYVTSSDFAVDVAENWQSEYLQFFLYIMVTVWLVQRGSPESKEPGKEGGGVRRGAEGRAATPTRTPRPWAGRTGCGSALYSNSLGLVMGLIFLLSWLAQSVAGQARTTPSSSPTCRTPSAGVRTSVSPDFWNRTPAELAVGVPGGAAWWCCRSTCASAARPSPSPWARRTRRPASRADR